MIKTYTKEEKKAPSNGYQVLMFSSSFFCPDFEQEFGGSFTRLSINLVRSATQVPNFS
jgi:hypothetical protein